MAAHWRGGGGWGDRRDDGWSDSYDGWGTVDDFDGRDRWGRHGHAHEHNGFKHRHGHGHNGGGHDVNVRGDNRPAREIIRDALHGPNGILKDEKGIAFKRDDGAGVVKSKCGPACHCGPDCQCSPGCGTANAKCNCKPATNNGGAIAERKYPAAPLVNGAVEQKTSIVHNPANGITEALKKDVLTLWQGLDAKAAISKEWSTPTVLLLTHQLGMSPMKINGITSMSPLANNALLTIESVTTPAGEKKWLMLYEVMVPDKPGRNGSESGGAVYRNALNKRGLGIDSEHFHWMGTDVQYAAVHHKLIGGDPLDFSRKTIEALKEFKTNAPGM